MTFVQFYLLIIDSPHNICFTHGIPIYLYIFHNNEIVPKFLIFLLINITVNIHRTYKRKLNVFTPKLKVDIILDVLNYKYGGRRVKGWGWKGWKYFLDMAWNQWLAFLITFIIFLVNVGLSILQCYIPA